MKYYVEGLPKKQIKVLKALGHYMAPRAFILPEAQPWQYNTVTGFLST
jgi:hypothetical protein